MTDIESIRRTKQNYLRDQITNNNWDADEFVDFLADRREEGYLILS